MINYGIVLNVQNNTRLNDFSITLDIHVKKHISFKGTDHAGNFMSLKCVVYYANYRGWHQYSKIQVVA